MFSKVLVANRGEIAVRVIRALDELGIASVAVYSEADRDAQHVKRAGEAYLLGPGPATESYLNVDKIMEVIEASGAEAVHPGYGFLAENAAFAKRLEDARVTFIGPPASAIEAMGSKTRARELMQKAGVPIVPGTTDPVETLEDAEKIAEEIGYPIAVKAAGGGGGKGFRVALEKAKLKDAFEGAAREGEKFFSDDTVYLERYLPDPRHVEVQVLADTHGTVVHLGERDCSIQRRHQKLIEESPAPLVDDELREKIGKIATDAAEAVGYTGAGTIEGLLQDGEYFFLEMNTRVQVEHCVTEATTGVDIVREQILIAAGEKLSFSQDDIRLHGHAIECRINAEDASKNFAPAPGTVAHYREPSGPGVRVDSGVVVGHRDHAALRPDGGQADRLGRRPRARHPAHAARAEGVRDRGRQDPDPVPQGDHGLRAVGQGRDLPRPDRGQEVAQGARLPGRAEGRRRRGRARDARLHGRGRRGKRFEVVVHGEAVAAAARRRATARAARRPARRAQVRRRRRRRRRHARLAAAGQRLQGAGRAGRRRRGGRARLHHRGDEDGERDHRPQGRQDRRAADHRRAASVTAGDTIAVIKSPPSDRPRRHDPRARRLAADPVRLHGGRQPGGAARGRRVGAAQDRRRRRHRRAGREATTRRSWSASCARPATTPRPS